MQRDGSLRDRSPPGALDFTIPQTPYRKWALFGTMLMLCAQATDLLPTLGEPLPLICALIGLGAWSTRRPQLRIRGTPGLIRIVGHVGNVPFMRRIEVQQHPTPVEGHAIDFHGDELVSVVPVGPGTVTIGGEAYTPSLQLPG